MKISEFDNLFMLEAIKQAEIAFELGEIPVGAVIIDRVSRKIIASGHNLVETDNNPTGHAELVAITRACRKLESKNLAHCDIYVSLEPCNMCAAAISFARLGRLFYAASDPKQGAVEHGGRFFTNNSCFHRPEIYPGLSAELSLRLLKSFFSNIRKSSL